MAHGRRRDELARAIEQTRARAVELTQASIDQHFRMMEQAFGSAGRAPLWERLRHHTSVQDPAAWERISRLVSGSVIVLVEDSDRLCGFRFDDVDDLVLVLAESHGFVFYVTDAACTFVLSFNDHDFLIASGRVSLT